MWLVRPPRRRNLHRASAPGSRRTTARSRRSPVCWTRTPPIAPPGSSRKDRQYWTDALAARPEPGSLTLSAPSIGHAGSFLRATAYLPRLMRRSASNVGRSNANKLARVMAAADGDLPLSPERRRRCRHRTAGGGAKRGARRIPGMASNVLPLRLAVHPGMTVSGTARRRRRGKFAQASHISAINSPTCAATSAAMPTAGPCSG